MRCSPLSTRIRKLRPPLPCARLPTACWRRRGSIGRGTFAVAIEQASLGGDLVGNLDLDLSARGGRVTIGRLTAELPGENHIEISGDLADGEAGPVFTGPIKLDGSKLRTLTRWAAGDREMSGQATIGKFALQATLSLATARSPSTMPAAS